MQSAWGTKTPPSCTPRASSGWDPGSSAIGTGSQPEDAMWVQEGVFVSLSCTHGASKPHIQGYPIGKGRPVGMGFQAALPSQWRGRGENSTTPRITFKIIKFMARASLL